MMRRRTKEQTKLTLYDYQSADVYSFSIIMFEMCGRMGPFGSVHNELDYLGKPEPVDSKYLD